MEYAEDNGVQFHIDILPAIPEDDLVKARLAPMIVGQPELAYLAIAFTDDTHPAYRLISDDWPMSNPRGFARWFESKMRGAAKRILLEKAESLPPHRWNTPLQMVIRILKHHRDAAFSHDPDHKPVSIIITTLAARAYDGQTDLRLALNGIVDRMPGLVTDRKVLNPTNPGENFADKWGDDPELEAAFWDWLGWLRRDIDRLGHDLTATGMKKLFEDRFGAMMEEEHFAPFTSALSAPAIAVAHSKTRTEPWGHA